MEKGSHDNASVGDTMYPFALRQPIDPLRGPAFFGKSILLAALVVWTWQFATAPMGAAAINSIENALGEIK